MAKDRKSVQTAKGLLHVGDKVKYVGDDPDYAEYKGKEGLLDGITGEAEQPYLYVVFADLGEDVETPVDEWERV